MKQFDPISDFLEFRAETNAAKNDLHANWDTPRRWQIIREHYKRIEPYILDGQRIDPYMLGLGDKMTPIEFALWQEIRYHGLPFYPQYPVGRRFVDFGDPVMRVAIEADGAAYHTKEKDEIRNHELKREGWRVFHVTGRDAYREKHALREVLHLYGKTIEDEDDPE